jgi:hypothetical protein
MKRQIILAMAIFSLVLFAQSSYAADQIESKSLSSNLSANVDVRQNPMLIDTAGFYPTRDQSSDSANIRRDVRQNPMEISPVGFYPTRNPSSDEHYGIAPAWEGREGNSSGMAKESYRAWDLPGINDNTN